MRALPLEVLSLCGAVLVACGSNDTASSDPDDGVETDGHDPFGAMETTDGGAPDGVRDASAAEPSGGSGPQAPEPGPATTPTMITTGPDVSEPPTPESTDEPPPPATPDDILGEGTDLCERQIAFDSLVLVAPPPFDVVIVADHSDSLSWSREDLSRGLGELLAEVSGSDARFYVLTSTQYGADSAAINRMNGDDLVPWRDPVTLTPYDNAMTSYVESCTDRDGLAIPCPTWAPDLALEYTAFGQFEFRMPEPIAAISKEMSEAQLAEQQERIRTAVLSLGGGASFEQPLCTLARYISEAPASLPENVVFLVISDEDDATEPVECRDWIEFESYRLDELTTNCSTDCDFRRYEMTAAAYRNAVSFSCVPTDDLGNPIPELSESFSISFGNAVSTCMTEPVPCDEQDIASAAYYCDPGELLEDCSRACSSEATALCQIDIADLGLDACGESFEFNAATFANVADYCAQAYELEGWTGCAGTGYAVLEGTGALTKRMSYASVTDGSGTQALLSYFKENANEALGPDGYFVEAIIHDPSFSCELGSGQSYGTNLAALATDGAVFPICESYAPALARVRGFAQELLQTEYTFELTDRETIEAVVVTDQWGRERALAETAYDYDWEASRLTLDPTALTSSDRSLNVEIEIHCAPVAR